MVRIHIAVPSYSLTEKGYKGTRTLGYQGVAQGTGQFVIIKLLKRWFPGLQELVQFCNQYTIAQALEFPGIVRPLDLINYGS
ncbi:MAG: hypothetical protein ACRC8A_10850 [Microcoleaceae cyanobacterium]